MVSDQRVDWPPVPDHEVLGGPWQSGGRNTVHTGGNGLGGNGGGGGSIWVPDQIVSAGSPPRKLTPREQALSVAQSLIAGHRDKDYGSPTDNFGRAAGALTALGYRAPDGSEIDPHDIAIIMLAIKLARLAHDPQNQDTWIDVAGYAGCGAEVAADETEGT